MSFFNLKGLPQPLLPFWGAERPLTQLLKTAFTFILSQHSLAHGGRECSAFKQKEQRKYLKLVRYFFRNCCSLFSFSSNCFTRLSNCCKVELFWKMTLPSQQMVIICAFLFVGVLTVFVWNTLQAWSLCLTWPSTFWTSTTTCPSSALTSRWCGASLPKSVASTPSSAKPLPMTPTVMTSPTHSLIR